MEECTHNCNSCNAECSSREKTDFTVKLNKNSSVKKVICVVSGKGGVGKSFVTASLAVMFNRKGYHTAILDADITGPSIPKAFGVNERARGTKDVIYPAKTQTGIDIMSVNLLLENETDPVIWRGAAISSTVKQFWSNVLWENVDYMFVDMPPGTGDVPLTVFQSVRPDGIIIVTTPQELVSMIVSKAVNMAKLMNIPIIGAVENMSYFECPDCNKKHYIFGKSNLEEASSEYGIDILGRLPVDTNNAKVCDNGKIEFIENTAIMEVANKIEEKLNK